MATTFELIQQAHTLTGEILALDPSDEEAEAALQLAVSAFLEGCDDKLGALRVVLGRIGSERAYLKDEEARLAGRRHVLDRAEERIKESATLLLEEREAFTGESKIKTPTYTAWLGSSTSVEGPEDPAQWPPEYLLERVTVTPAKAQAAADLRAGRQIPGLRLVTRRYPVFR